MKGTIKKYLSYRGFGFIEAAESENDIFFHSSNFQSQAPKENQRVMFEVVDTPKGKEAVDVRIIQSDIQGASDESDSVKQIPMGKSGLRELNGVGPKYLELLEASGLQSIESLTKYTPEMLLTILHETNGDQSITIRPPTLTRVEEWIQSANNWK
jgi:cold shock CspA family protein